jgi:hypothetical protein
MFCDGCGASVQPDQAFCGRCGKKIIGPVVAIAGRSGRVQEHLRFIGILWLAYSVFNAIGGILVFVANRFFIHGNVPSFLHPLLIAIGWLVLLKSAAGVAAGFGLLQREVWARTLTLIVAFIALFTNIPFGTALGIYSMWVLLPRESEQEYEAMSAAKVA